MPEVFHHNGVKGRERPFGVTVSHHLPARASHANCPSRLVISAMVACDVLIAGKRRMEEY
jgi:hypothetical protein